MQQISMWALLVKPLVWMAFAVSRVPHFSCACVPWSASTCTRWKDQLDFRWIIRNEEHLPDQEDVVYRFYATVDQIQRFQLNNTAFIATMNATINPLVQPDRRSSESFLSSIYNFMKGLYLFRGEPSLTVGYLEKPTFISLYGTGSKSRIAMPRSHHYSSTIIYEPHAPACAHGPAIVSMLVFNTTLDNGCFYYASNNTAPLGVGFHPTCTKNDVCRMDASLQCIGTPGRKNCAICLDPLNPSDIVGKDITIFNTYYGTDARGHRLMTGSSNPLNFRQLAMDAIYNKIAADISLLSQTFKSLNPFSEVDSWDQLPNNAVEGIRTNK